MRDSRDLIRVVTFFLGVVVPSVLKASEEATPLASIEPRLRGVYESVSPAIVRIARMEDREVSLASGVIVTADGYVVTFRNAAQGEGLRRRDSVVVHLADGRHVKATKLGRSMEWGFGVLKISEEGPWPHVQLAEPAKVKAGQQCVLVGYPLRADQAYDRRPALRLGCVTMYDAPIWLATSCMARPEDFGSGVFDLQGRLLGVTTRLYPSEDPIHTGIEVVKTYWADLAAGKSVDGLRNVAAKEDAVKRSGGTGPKSPSEEKDLAEAATGKPKAATVRIRRTSQDHLASGVIVSSDGYVTTCAHADQLPGEKVTVCLPDGRDAAGVVLGTNRVTDLGLVKITDEGPWPHVELGGSSMMKRGAPCLVTGFPASHQERQPVIQTVKIHRDYPGALSITRLRGRTGGMSGGGIFDLEGCLLAVYTTAMNPKVELVRRQWDHLAAGKPVEVTLSEPLGRISEGFSRVAKGLPPIVVEVLSDNKQRALGTIVGSDGRILTKASELDGGISCRLADGRVLPATIEKVWREHDLAALKVNARRLPKSLSQNRKWGAWRSAEGRPQSSPTGGSLRSTPATQPRRRGFGIGSKADWSRPHGVSTGSLVAALIPGKPPLVGVVCQPARPIPSEPRWLGEGLRDSDRGLQVDELSETFGVDELSWAFGFDIPIRKGDILVEVEGHPTPDLDTFVKLMKSELAAPNAHPGDPVRLDVKQGDDRLELHFPLLPSLRNKHAGSLDSPRRSGFPHAFDTDIPLTRDLCGGPVIDRTGRVVGIVIASRGMSRAKRGPTHVVPADVARRVTEQLEP